MTPYETLQPLKKVADFINTSRAAYVPPCSFQLRLKISIKSVSDNDVDNPFDVPTSSVPLTACVELSPQTLDEEISWPTFLSPPAVSDVLHHRQTRYLQQQLLRLTLRHPRARAQSRSSSIMCGSLLNDRLRSSFSCSYSFSPGSRSIPDHHGLPQVSNGLCSLRFINSTLVLLFSL